MLKNERIFTKFLRLKKVSSAEQYIPLRYRKAARVWCDGARETHTATCHNRMTPCYPKELLKFPRFIRSL